MKTNIHLIALLALISTEFHPANAAEQNYRTLKEVVVDAEMGKFYNNLFHVGPRQPSYPANLEEAGKALSPNLNVRRVIKEPQDSTRASYSGNADGLWNITAYPRARDANDYHTFFNYTGWRDINLNEDSENNAVFSTWDDTYLDFAYQRPVIDRSECEEWTKKGPLPVRFRVVGELKGSYTTPYLSSIKIMPHRHYAVSDTNPPVYSDNPEQYDYASSWSISNKPTQESAPITLDQKICEDSNGLSVEFAINELQHITLKRIRIEVTAPF